MTPSAVTHAGKGAVSGRKPAGSGARRTHASATARPASTGRTAPRAARRVSGPLRGRIAVPTRSPRVRRPASTRRQPLSARAVAFVRSLPDHGLLDRVVRGRTWIALLGLMLVGIVAMQVEVLKLGASEGRALQQSAALQSRNESLRAAVASDSAEQRIESLAAGRYGMVMPAPDEVVFLPQNERRNAAHAAHNISSPDATNFLASLPVSTQASDPVAAGTTDAAAGTTAGTTDTGATAPTGTATGTTDTGTSTTAPATTDTGGTSTDPTTPAATTVSPTAPATSQTTDNTTPPGAAATTTSAAGGASITGNSPAG